MAETKPSLTLALSLSLPIANNNNIPQSQQPETGESSSTSPETTHKRKRKYMQNPPETQQQTSASTESTASCKSGFGFPTPMNKKPRIKQEITDASHESSNSTKKKPVSTKLTLFDETWPSNPCPALAVQAPLSDNGDKRKDLSTSEAKKLARNIREMKNCGDEKKQRNGVSTELKLFDPWKITKELTKSDLGNLSRLLISKDSIKEDVLCFFSKEMVDKVEKEGYIFEIWDSDTKTEHRLMFKLWSSSMSYVFMNGWRKEFVSRRQLKERDEIGLYWDLSNSRFVFSVLERAQSF